MKDFTGESEVAVVVVAAVAAVVIVVVVMIMAVDTVARVMKWMGVVSAVKGTGSCPQGLIMAWKPTCSLPEPLSQAQTRVRPADATLSWDAPGGLTTPLCAFLRTCHS